MARVKDTEAADGRTKNKARIKLLFTKAAREKIDAGKRKKEQGSKRKMMKKALQRSDETGTKKCRTGTKKMTRKEAKALRDKKTIDELKKKVMTGEMRRKVEENKKKRKSVPVPRIMHTAKKTKKAKKRTPKRRNRDTSSSSETETGTDDDSTSSEEEEEEEGPGSSHKHQRLNLWEPDAMEIAVLVGKENRGLPRRQRVGIRAICKSFNVPRSTLDKRIRGVVTGHQHMSGGNHSPRLLKHTQEDELVTFILTHADAGFPLTATEIRELAHEYATVNRMKMTKNKDEKLSYSWQRRFLGRNPTISVKTPQDLSAHRAACANKLSVAHWYKNLDKVYKKYDIQSGLSVWNVDETG